MWLSPEISRSFMGTAPLVCVAIVHRCTLSAPRRPAMLGDVVELSVVVRDLDAAVERYTKLFCLNVHKRSESKQFGFKNAILPTGIGHIELMQPTDPDKAVGRFLAKHVE